MASDEWMARVGYEAYFYGLCVFSGVVFSYDTWMRMSMI